MVRYWLELFGMCEKLLINHKLIKTLETDKDPLEKIDYKGSEIDNKVVAR